MKMKACLRHGRLVNCMTTLLDETGSDRMTGVALLYYKHKSQQDYKRGTVRSAGFVTRLSVSHRIQRLRCTFQWGRNTKVS
jgi:hypothetical protein